MATNIKMKIDVNKITKERLYKGNKGLYLNCTIIVYDEPDQYGYNGIVIEEISKQEREAGKQGTILGNIRYIEKKQPPSFELPTGPDDLPF